MDTEDFKTLHNRVSRLEEWRVHIDIERAKEQVDREYIKQRFDNLENAIKDFRVNLSSYARWAFFIIAGTLITGYIIPFILSGKLAGVN